MPQKRSDMRRVKEVLRLAHELGYSLRQSLKVGAAVLDVGAQLSGTCRSCGCALRGHRRQKRGGDRGAAVRAARAAAVAAPARLGGGGHGVAQARCDAASGVAGVSGSASRRLQLQPVPAALSGASASCGARTADAADAFACGDVRGRLRRHDNAGGDGRWRTPGSIFVGTLPFSTLIYTEATWTQTTEDWLGSHVRMFNARGGSVPKLVPDNLKTGVTHASFYDPVLNPSYLALARHYGIGVVPARVRHPRDKALAENGVQQVERWVLAPLRNRTSSAWMR